MTEKQLLHAFNKALKEYEVDTYEVESAQVMDSWDMFISPGSRRMDIKPINHREFVRKMLAYLP